MRYILNVNIYVEGLDEAASAERAMREEFGDSAIIESIFAQHPGLSQQIAVPAPIDPDPPQIAVPAPTEEEKDPPEVKVTVSTIDEAIAQAYAYATENGSPALVKVLKHFGVKRVSELAPEQVDDFLGMVNN